MSDTNKSQVARTENRTDQFDTLASDIGNHLSAGLSDLMSKLLNSAQDKLFKMSDEADNNKDRTRYFELMNQLRTLKSTIADNFNNNIKEYLLPVKEFEGKQAKHKLVDDFDELSLVGQDDMEGLVLVNSIGERADARYNEKLSQLEARLEHLALKSSKTFKPEALTAINFCQAFDDALADNFDNTNKKLLFSMFDAEVAHKLDDLYDSINISLIDANILPKIKLSISKQQSSSLSTPITASHIETDQQSSFAEETLGNISDECNARSNNISGFAMTAAPGGNYRNSNQNMSPLPMSGAGLEGGASTHPAGSSNIAASRDYSQKIEAVNGEYQHYTAGIPASRVGHVLSNFIGTSFTPGASDKSAADNDEFYPQTTPKHFGHEEIIQALSTIQSLPQFNQQDKLHFDGEAIKQAVLKTIATSSGGAITKHINQIAEKTIDFIELIFDAIIEDENISDTIKTLLLRLQIPIIKASMSDQEFFIYDEHPARVLLDTIADTGVGINKHTDNVYIFLDKVISSILGEHEISTEIFQGALDDLNTYIIEQEELTRAREEEEQKQLLRKHARATILKSLRATTTGKTLPESVHPLVLKRWPTLMFNHYLTKGKENDEWVNIVLTLHRIINSVQIITSAEHLAKLMLGKDDLFAQAEQYLNISCNSKKDVKSIMSIYIETVQQRIDDANFNEEEVGTAQEAISNTEPVEEAPVEEVIDKPTIPPNIMPGSWFKLYMGEDKTARRCKLSVILVEDANLMFVNHKGELIIEKSFDEFNKEVASNRTKIIMGHSAFENAFKAVINRLN